MMKRITWFTSGLLAGITGAWYGSRKLKDKAESLKPINVAKDTANRVRGRVDDVVDAIREGRSAMRDKELELRTAHDPNGTTSEVVSVEPGRVVVLRSVDGRNAERRVRRRRP